MKRADRNFQFPWRDTPSEIKACGVTAGIWNIKFWNKTKKHQRDLPCTCSIKLPRIFRIEAEQQSLESFL